MLCTLTFMVSLYVRIFYMKHNTLDELIATAGRTVNYLIDPEPYDVQFRLIAAFMAGI